MRYIYQFYPHFIFSQVVNLIKGHGTQTGHCVGSDRAPGVSVCEIQSWCPVERDELPLLEDGPLIPGFENYTVFIKVNTEYYSYWYEYRIA